jgi:hypothetical protein
MEIRSGYLQFPIFASLLPAFLPSIHGVKKLVSLLLNSKDNELILHHYDEALAVWDVQNENERPTIPQFQKNWDNINIFNSPRDLARFKALQCRESGSWIHAIPSPNIGILLDNTFFQVFFFFFNCHSRFLPYGFLRYLSVGRFFHSNFLVPLPSQVMRRGSGALSPATHAHSTSHSQTYTTTFIHPWAPFPDGTRTRADLAVVAERVLILPSTTLPSAPRRHTHTSMARRRFLPLKKSSPFGGIQTH